jgi:AcrR family transcriptional regulator
MERAGLGIAQTSGFLVGSRGSLRERAEFLRERNARPEEMSRPERNAVTAEISVRQRILNAALDIVETDGVEALTQPRVAKAAGVRQSHLTYYFPRKADLFVALLRASHERASHDRAERDLAGAESEDVLDALRNLMLGRGRMRFFLAIVLGASQEEELRPILAAHAQGLTRRVAAYFGREADDPAAAGFVDRLRGLGLRALLEPGLAEMERDELERLAAEFGLVRRKN